MDIFWNNKVCKFELECPSGRHFTVSLALPGSILDNAQSPELRTYLAGQVRWMFCTGRRGLYLKYYYERPVVNLLLHVSCTSQRRGLILNWNRMINLNFVCGPKYCKFTVDSTEK